MEIASHEQEDDCHFAGRTLSDISIASNASGKGSNFGGIRHVQDTRVKFLCSHGGKILPRPSDKKLRYVGGETRMISLPRHIHFNAFQLKMAEIYGSDVALRYQLPEEDLDALVSVASDEDLENMMEECDRLDATEGSSRLRVFVFSVSDLAAGDLNVIADPKQYEQRYVDAVNTVLVDVSVRQNDSFVPSDPLKYPAGVQISHACNNQPMQEKVPGNFQAFQVEQFMPSGIYSTSNLPIGSNIPGPIVPPPRQQVTRHWNELASCQHAGIINSHGPVPTNAEDFIDIESVESAASSASSHHDLYHRYRSANTTQFLSHPELVANKHDDIQLVGSEQHNILDARVPSGVLNNMPNARFGGPISPARSFSDLAEQMYGSEAIGEMKNLVHEMNDDQPLSPGAMLQRQLQADQCTESGLHVRKEAMQVPLDGIVRQPTQTARFLEQQEQIKQLPVHTWATVSTREAPGQMLSDYSRLPSEVFPPTSGVPMPCITPSVRPPLIEKTPDAGIQALPLQQLSVHEASIVVPQIDYTKMNGNGTIGISYLAAPPTAEVLSVSHLQNSATDMSKIDEKKQPNELLEQIMISPVVFPDQRVLDAVDYGYQNQANWLASELASLPLENTEACAALDQSDKVMNASVLTNNQVVGTGLSLIDEPVDKESRHLSDAFLGSSAAFRDCSTIDMVSGVLPSGPLTTYSARIISQAENLVSASFSALGRLHQEADVSEVTDLPHSIGGLRRGSGDQSLLKQSVYLGDSRETESYRNGNAGVVVREGGETTAEASQTFNFLAPMLPSETWGTCLQTECKEHASILHVSHEHELKAPQSSLIIEEELTTENSMVEIEVMDRPSNAAALAEAEAIARGLQTIRNCDLEELRELGSGTFGTVYHGKWRGTDVAIKRIKSSCFTGRASERERLIADFWQEAFILGQLHHPNVVAFYGVVPDGPDGTLATVTEFMVNGSLKQAIHKKDRSVLDRQKRLLIAMDAAFGMEYLHKKNVVHFDLKCENLLVNLRDPQRPICKVGDLGLSKVKQQTMISGGVRGTLPWMAPELLNGSSSLVSEKVDVFSFGIVLWELLTGEEPYADMHYGAIIGGIVTNTLRPPVPRWCDAAWKSLMEACWSADPAERPTFTEIASSLRAMEASLQNATKGQGQAAGAG